MVELEFLGIQEDRLVLTDPEGGRYLLTPTPELVSALRTVSRPRPLAVPAALNPRDIQARLRAGETVAEIAASTEMPAETIATFESPVRGERRFAVQRAQNVRIADGPRLGELVIDRLAARGVDPASMEWDATRLGNQPWEIELTFIQSAQVHSARWELRSGRVAALDEEARWLSETVTPARAETGTILAIHDGSAPPPSPTPPLEPVEGVAAGTEELLQSLMNLRGVRQVAPTFTDDDDEDEATEGGEAGIESPFGPVATGQVDVTVSEAAAHLATPRPQLSRPSWLRLAASNDDDPAAGEDPAQDPGQDPGQDSQRKPEQTPAQTGATPVLPGFEQLSDHEAASKHSATPDTERPEAGEGEGPAKKSRSNRKRQSVPSWDEIVFGTKPGGR